MQAPDYIKYYTVTLISFFSLNLSQINEIAKFFISIGAIIYAFFQIRKITLEIKQLKNNNNQKP